MKVIGYHGTPEENIKGIEEDGLLPSDKTGWLGKGVYFFCDLRITTDDNEFTVCNAKMEAFDWGKKVAKRKTPTLIKTGVFKSELEIDDDLLFDTIGKSKHRSDLEKEIKKDPSRYEYKIIKDLFDHQFRKYNAIRMLTDGMRSNADYKSGLIARPQIQLCIKEVSNIIKTELVVLV